MSENSQKPSGPASGAGDELIGTVIGGRYRLDVLLGGGAMGRVYRAEHVHMKKPLAVKVLNPEHTKSPELVARFEREATAAANIEHPNVVAATDFGKLDDGTAYLALELVEGKNLRAEVAHGPLDVRRALHVARQIAAGLVAAHARNIVHRDLKPENVVLVEKDGDPDFAKILDFGVAKLAPESGKSPLTKVGAVLGTLDYMAPEQALGQEVDHRADLYALGAVLYEMLSGVCPYEGESSAAMLVEKLKKPPRSLRERAPTLAIPGALEALVMKLLEKDKKDRPESAAFVVAELDRLIALAPKGGAANSPASAPRPPRPVAIHTRPTFLPTDPLPAFTFPPLESASKKLAEEVKQAVAKATSSVPPRPTPGTAPPAPRRSVPGPPVRSPIVSSSPAVDALLASAPPDAKPQAPPAMSPVSSSPSVDALLANLPGPTGSPPAAASGDAPLPSAPPGARAEPRRELRVRAAAALEAAIVWVDDNRRFLPRFVKRPLRRVSSGVLLAGVVVAVGVLVIALLVWASGSGESPAPARVDSVPAAPASS